MKFYFNLAIKYITRHIILSLITILGVGSSIAIILSVSIVNSAIGKSIEKVSRELGTGNTDIWIEERSENTRSKGSILEGINQNIIDKIYYINGIKSIHPSLVVNTDIYSKINNKNEEIIIYGIDLSMDYIVRNHILSSGKIPEDDQCILIGEKLAGNLNVDIGSNINIMTPEGELNLTVSGILAAHEGSGLINNNNVIFADLKKIQHFFKYDNKITSLNIVLKPDIKPDIIISKLKLIIPKNFNISIDPLFQSILYDQTKTYRNSTFLFSLISIIIAFFIIYNTFFSSVEQNKKEIGLLRLAGMTSGQIFLLYIVQSTIYWIFGSFFGVFLGLILSTGLLYLVSLLFQYQTIFFIFPSINQILFVCFICFILSISASVFPGISAGKISPINLFNLNDKNNYKNIKLNSINNIIGIMFILIGIIIETYTSLMNIKSNILIYLVILMILTGFFILLNFIISFILKFLLYILTNLSILQAYLSIKTLLIKFKSTLITIGCISFTIALIIAFIGMTTSIKKTVYNWLNNTQWADLIIYSTTGMEIDNAILDKLIEYKFIKEVNPMRYVFIPYNHKKLSDNGFIFQGINPELFFTFSNIKVEEGNTGKIIEELQNNKNAILINKNLSIMLGLKKDDILFINTSKGMQRFEILGTIFDYTDFMHRIGKTIYGSQKILNDIYDTKGYTVIQIKLFEGFSRNSSKKIINDELSKNYNIKIITHDEEKNDVSKSIDRIFSIFYIINIACYLIVFFGIFQTIFLNVIHNIYELTILRIVGCSENQIRMQIIFEALIMMIIGTFFALSLGLYLGKIFLNGSSIILGPLKYYLPFMSLIIFLIINIFVAILATLYPIYILKKNSIREILEKMEQI